MKSSMLDQMETSEVQGGRIRYQRSRGDGLAGTDVFGLQPADIVLRARGKMIKNKANGLADCLVTEMLQCLPTE